MPNPRLFAQAMDDRRNGPERLFAGLAQRRHQALGAGNVAVLSSANPGFAKIRWREIKAAMRAFPGPPGDRLVAASAAPADIALAHGFSPTRARPAAVARTKSTAAPTGS